MKVSRNVLSAIMVIGIMSCGVNIYGASAGTKPSVPQKKVTPIATPVPTSTPSQIAYITFEKDEHVRITQPTGSSKDNVKEGSKKNDKDDIIFFNSQLNVMGEARVGTNIVVKVYTTDKENKEPFILYKTYEEIEVGATQTFNQLVDLKTGRNKIVVGYTNKDNKNVEGTIELAVIRRESEAVKQNLKNSAPDLKQLFLPTDAEKR